MEELKTEANFETGIFYSLKAQRDALHKTLVSGGVWSESGTVH